MDDRTNQVIKWTLYTLLIVFSFFIVGELIDRFEINQRYDNPATKRMWSDITYWLFKVPFGFSSPDNALSYRIFFWGWFLMAGVYYVRTGKNFWD